MTATQWEGELTALESRAETDSLTDLHVQRRQMLPEYAALRALHGPNGKWDAKRKQMLEAIKVRVRMEMAGRGEKCTDASVDAAAHADEQYATLVDQGIAGATRYVELDIAMTEIVERISARESALYVYGQELKLAR